MKSESTSFKRRSFLKAVGSTGALAAVGTVEAAPSINVYVYQNIPESLDWGGDIDDITAYAKSGLRSTLDELVNEGVIGGWNLVDRTSDKYPNLTTADNCDALTPFQEWLWDNGFREGTSGSGEHAAHVLVRDSTNDGDAGGCAAGVTLWSGDDYHSVWTDYDDDGYQEGHEAVPRAIVGGDLDGSDDKPYGIGDADEIETAAAHEFGHLVVEGTEGSGSDSGCWDSLFSVSPSGHNEHAVGTWSDAKSERSIMGRYYAGGGEPCPADPDSHATGFWHSTCYQDLAMCTRDSYT